MEYIRGTIERRVLKRGANRSKLVLDVCVLEAFVIAFEAGAENWKDIVSFAKAVLPIAVYACSTGEGRR
jgi:hypothetical protein